MAFVQQVDTENTAAGTSLAVVINGTVAGNILVCAALVESPTATCSVSDGANTFTELTGTGLPLTQAGEAQLRLFRAPIGTGGDRTVTFTWSASVPFRSIYVAESSGVDAFDIGGGLRQTTGTTRNAGSVTNTGNGDHFAIVADYNALAGITVGSTFTARGTGWQFGSGMDNMMAEDRALSGVGSQSAQWGMNNGAISYAVQAVFLAAGGDILMAQAAF